jgi:hypothetical protein
MSRIAQDFDRAMNMNMTRNFNLPPGVSLRDIDPPVTGERCAGCDEPLAQFEKTFETPCGQFCVECLEVHLTECAGCKEEVQ